MLRTLLIAAVAAWCGIAGAATPVTPQDPSAPLPISAFYADPTSLTYLANTPDR